MEEEGEGEGEGEGEEVKESIINFIFFNYTIYRYHIMRMI